MKLYCLWEIWEDVAETKFAYTFTGDIFYLYFEYFEGISDDVFPSAILLH